MHDLTARQTETLNYLTQVIRETGICPSYRQIGAALGIGSTNGVSEHIRALERKGYLERVGRQGASRSIRLTPKASPPPATGPVAQIPLVGRIAAGQPLLAQQHTEQVIQVDASLVPQTGTLFALRVQGQSMIEDGIFDGDVLFVRQAQTARNGDIAVVLVDGDATVKRFYHEGARIRLQPANAAMDPIYLGAHSGEVRVMGIAVGVYRQL